MSVLNKQVSYFQSKNATTKCVEINLLTLLRSYKHKELIQTLRLSEKEFADYTLSRIPPTPPNFLTIVALNKQGSYEGYTPSELEAGANRCAIV